MSTSNLEKILSRAGDLATEKKKMAAQVTTICQERAAVINDAAGPTDKAALDKLNVLASRESIANNQLQLIDRKIAGLHASAMNEATHVCLGLQKELTDRRAKLLGQLDADLARAYPDAEQRKRVLAQMRIPPPAIHALNNAIGGLSSSMLQPPETTGLQFAQQIFRETTSAIQTTA